MDRTTDPHSLETLAALAAACQAVPAALGELIAELGNSLSLEETLATLDEKLREVVRYDSLVYHVPLDPSAVRDAPADDAASSAARCLVPVLRPQCLALPLLKGGELAGVVEFRLAAGTFSEDDLRLLLAIRRKLTAAVWNARKFEAAEQWKMMDAASGLPNGRALFLRLDAELARCRRRHEPLALVVCEIEGVRREQLHAIAQGLRTICREEDCVARQDDAFAFVLTGFTPGDLPDKRVAIEAAVRKAARVESVRIGAAFSPDDGTYAEDLLAAADQRLNDVCAAP